MARYGLKLINDYMCSEEFQLHAIKSTEMWLSHFKNEPSLVFDCGANVGVYTLAFAKLTKARIVAFEPVLDTYNKLLLNISLNSKLCSNVQALNVGLWSSNCCMHVGQPVDREAYNTGLYSVHHLSGKNIVLCNFMDVNNAIDAFGIPDFMKLDVEGSENEIISAIKLDKLKRICAITLEYNKNYTSTERAADILSAASFLHVDPRRTRRNAYDTLWINKNFMTVDKNKC